MSGYSEAAWLQYHSGRRLGHIPPPGNDVPRRICRCCGLLMTLEWDAAIYGGQEPVRYGYQDPSDEPGFNVEYRGIR